MRGPDFPILILNSFLWILILLTLGPPLLVLYVWRKIVNLCADYVKNDFHPAVPNDTYFAIDTCENLPTVNAVQIWKIKGHVDVHVLRKHFASCFFGSDEARKRYMNLYCYLVKFGGYVFKKSIDPTALNIKSHIYEHHLNGQDSIESFVANWMFKKKFRPKTPLWELVLVQLSFDKSKLEEYETLLLFKIHHCLADGYSFVHIVDTLTGNSSPYMVKEYEEDFLSKVCYFADCIEI